VKRKGRRFYGPDMTPPSFDEVLEYFDDYSDLVNCLVLHGRSITPVDHIGDSSGDSLEAFVRTYHAHTSWRTHRERMAEEAEARRRADELQKRARAELVVQEQLLNKYWNDEEYRRFNGYLLHDDAVAARDAEKLRALAAKVPWGTKPNRQRIIEIKMPKPKPRRECINPFALARQRKIRAKYLPAILEKTRRIREELRRRREAEGQ